MFNEINIDNTWSFSDKTIKDTSYITHGYYTYPAKFIPQLAKRLILEYSEIGDIVIDPFMGSGTTILEAIINRRIGIGTDINDLAYLITKVKTTPIRTNLLLQEFSKIEYDLKNKIDVNYDINDKQVENEREINKRIDYWFTEEQKNHLLVIFDKINELEDREIREFFLLSFAQILKSSSIWLQKSVKPTRDFNKNLSDPMKLFFNQTKKMIKKNDEFRAILDKDIISNIDKHRIIKNQDARILPCGDSEASLIVTSPPYVTSYEYADLHQLPSLWFNYFTELSLFRKKFIGSSYKSRLNEIDLKSNIANQILNNLQSKKKSIEVKNYFADMLESFIEMKRVLKKGGKACIVIGNTQFKSVDILNAEVFKEQFENIGFELNKIIHRKIPSKMLPSTRDKITGQFVKKGYDNLKLAYPSEYILVMEKL